MPADIETTVNPKPKVGVEMPASFDGLLRGIEAVVMEQRHTAQMLQTLVSQQEMFSQRTMESNKTMVDTLQRIGGGGGGRGAVYAQGDDMVAVRHEPDAAAVQRAQQRFESARAKPIQTIRKDVFQRAAQAVNDRWAPTIDQRGRMHDPSSGQFLPSDPSEWRAGLKMGQVARTTVGNIAERGFNTQSLLSGLPAKWAGGVGLALGAVEGGTEFLENQRQAAMGFQSALGISNLEAQRERGRSQLFEFGMMGTMGSGDASRMFETTTGLGLTGSARDRALSFGADAYRRLGMSVEQSMKLVALSVERGETSFGRLTQALDGVTQAARDAGVNAENARKMFVQNYEAISQVVGGAGGVAGAEGLATAQALLGPQFQDASLAGTFSSPMLRRQAAARGMTYGQLFGQLQGGPGATADFLQGMGQQSQQFFSRRYGGLQEAIARAVRGHVGPGGDISRVPNEVWQTLGQQVAGSVGDPALLVELLGFQGLTGITEVEAPQVLARILAGGDPRTVASASIREQQEAMKSRRYTGDATLNTVAASSGNAGGRQFDPTPARAFHHDRLKRDIFKEGSLAEEGFLGGGWAQSLADDYLGQVRSTGMRNPVIERLLKEGVGDRKFKVRVGDKERVVDIQTAVRNFGDQLLSGEAVIFSGEGAGQTVGDLYGFGTQDSSSVRSYFSSRQSADLGKSVEEARRDRGKGEGSGGRVVIQASPDLARWLHLVPEGNVDIEWGRYGGAPPSGFMPPGMEGG